VWSTVCDQPPIAHELKHQLRDRWVRFHSLPDGKRYADSTDEWEELLRRARTLLDEASRPGDQMMVVTGLYGESGSVPSRSQAMAAVQPLAEYWCEVPERSVPEVTLDEPPWPWHLWVSWVSYEPGCFDPLVRRAADWEVVGVLIVATSSRIALHPYDGGTDVILPTPGMRDRWRDRHLTWTSPHPSGF
jgi:hypothetical protein